MTSIEKYKDIDLSKLPESAKEKVKIASEVLLNPLSQKPERKAELELAEKNMETIYNAIKAKYPDALKSLQKKEPEPTTPVAKAKKIAKQTIEPPKKGSTKASVQPTKRGNVTTLAKEIRKEGEAWKDAIKRAGEMISKQQKVVVKQANKQFDKLQAFLDKHPELKNVSVKRNSGKGTPQKEHSWDVMRDASRPAKKAGRRVSADGNVYYEYRENRVDRFSKKYPMLAKGGKVGKKHKYFVDLIDGKITTGKVHPNYKGFGSLKEAEEFSEKYKKGEIQYAKGGKVKNNYDGRYDSIHEFISDNNLDEEAIKLFGKDWEADNDVGMIEELLSDISNDDYLVKETGNNIVVKKYKYAKGGKVKDGGYKVEIYSTNYPNTDIMQKTFTNEKDAVEFAYSVDDMNDDGFYYNIYGLDSNGKKLIKVYGYEEYNPLEDTGRGRELKDENYIKRLPKYKDCVSWQLDMVVASFPRNKVIFTKTFDTLRKATKLADSLGNEPLVAHINDKFYEEYEHDYFAKGGKVKNNYTVFYYETEDDFNSNNIVEFDTFSDKNTAIDRAEKNQSKFGWFSVAVNDGNNQVIFENNFGEYAKGGKVHGYLRKRFEGYTDEELQIFNGDNEETLKNWNREDAIEEAIHSVLEESDEYAKGGKVKDGGYKVKIYSSDTPNTFIMEKTFTDEKAAVDFAYSVDDMNDDGLYAHLYGFDSQGNKIVTVKYFNHYDEDKDIELDEDYVKSLPKTKDCASWQVDFYTASEPKNKLLLSKKVATLRKAASLAYGLTEEPLYSLINNELYQEYEHDYFAKGGKVKSRLSDTHKYVPNRMIQEIEVERKGKTTFIDGADILDGVYVRKGVKFAAGGEVANLEVLKLIEAEFGHAPQGADIRALRDGIVEVYYYSPNVIAENWAMTIKDKYGDVNEDYNVTIHYIDTANMKNKFAKGGEINMDRHIWEGWTVGDFIEALEIPFKYHPKFKSKDEVKKWAMSEQPYYKKYIKEVVDYYWNKNENKYAKGGKVKHQWIPTHREVIEWLENNPQFPAKYEEDGNPTDETYTSAIEEIQYLRDIGEYAKGGEVHGNLRKRFEGYTDEELQIFNGDNEETLKNWNREDAIEEAIHSVLEESDEYAKGGKVKSRLSDTHKYVPNRMIQEIEVERKGKTTFIDGADILDGVYVRKGVKFAAGGKTKETYKLEIVAPNSFMGYNYNDRKGKTVFSQEYKSADEIKNLLRELNKHSYYELQGYDSKGNVRIAYNDMNLYEVFEDLEDYSLKNLFALFRKDNNLSHFKNNYDKCVKWGIAYGFMKNNKKTPLFTIPYSSLNRAEAGAVDYSYDEWVNEVGYYVNNVPLSKLVKKFAAGGIPQKYTITVWETEEDRDAGESFIAEILSDLKEAKARANKLYNSMGYAAVEVIDANDEVVLHLSDDSFAKGGRMNYLYPQTNIGSNLLFDLKYGDVFEIIRPNHTATHQYFVFLELSDAHDVSLKVRPFPKLKDDFGNKETYITGVSDGDIRILSREEAGKKLLEYQIKKEKFAKGGELDMTKYNGAGMFAKGGKTKKKSKVVRGYFDDEPYEYAAGGKILNPKNHGNSITLPQGKYYIGDLCYVIGDEWDNLLDYTAVYDVNGKLVEYQDGFYEWTTNNGTPMTFGWHGTAHGDGSYSSNIRGNVNGASVVGVDSGTIGIVSIDSLEKAGFLFDSLKNALMQGGYGIVHEFDRPFVVYLEENPSFGEIHIQTEHDDDNNNDDWGYDDNENYNNEEDEYAKGGFIDRTKNKNKASITADFNNDFWVLETIFRQKRNYLSGISKYLGIDKSLVKEKLDALVKKGWVRVEENTAEPHLNQYYATEKGKNEYSKDKYWSYDIVKNKVEQYKNGEFVNIRDAYGFNIYMNGAFRKMGGISYDSRQETIQRAKEIIKLLQDVNYKEPRFGLFAKGGKTKKGDNLPNTVDEYFAAMNEFSIRLGKAEINYAQDNGAAYREVERERDEFYNKTKSKWYAELNKAEINFAKDNGKAFYDVKSKIDTVFNRRYAEGGYIPEGEDYEYVNSFGIPQEDFVMLVDAWHKNEYANSKEAEREYFDILNRLEAKFGVDNITDIVIYIQDTHDSNIEQNEMGEYATWEMDVADELSEIMNIDYSDAQGIMSVNSFHVAQSWGKGLTAKETAMLIYEINEARTPKFWMYYTELIQAVMDDVNVSEEEATKLVDKYEVYLTDMIEAIGETDVKYLADIITNNEEIYAKGGYMAHGGTLPQIKNKSHRNG